MAALATATRGWAGGRDRFRRRPTAGRWITGLRAAIGGRRFDVYLPAGRRRAALPVVVLLHGCNQSGAEFADATRFTTVADRNRVLLVVPGQERHHHPRRCWRWYSDAHQHRGGGEPAALVAITREVLAERRRWRADPQRVYVAGLSAGGAMALVLAVAYPDVFAAVGLHSAPAYRAATHSGQVFAAMAGRTGVPAPLAGAGAIPPTVVVQGGADRVVRPLNGRTVVDQWLAHRDAAGGVGRSRTDTGATADGRRYVRQRWYGDGNRRVLEYWSVEGLGHAWSGGRPGGSYSDPDGPRASTLMWTFFRRHRLPG